MNRKYIDYNGKKLSYFEKEGNEESPCLLFIHGFAGDASDWGQIINRLENQRCLAVDLPGHGNSFKSDKEEDYTTEAFSSAINSIITELSLDNVVIIGYSMGGRVALSYYLKYLPKNVSALILESTSPGISDEQERKKRFVTDKERSASILNTPLKKFFKNWYKAPIFKTLQSKPELLNEIVNKRVSNDKLSLSLVLKGFSPSLMPTYWERLNDIKIPLLIIYGEEDFKYSEISSKIKNINKSTTLRGVKDASHVVHLEKPGDFYDIIFRFFNK